MKRTALEKAVNRLFKAQKALNACKGTTWPWDFEEEWGNFLLAYNSIFAALEQGAKGCAKSEPWFGRLKNQRRKDPLLSYLHQARNSDEHGVEKVLRMQKGTTMQAVDGSKINVEVKDGGIKRVWSPTGAPIVVTEDGPKVVLTTVTDSKHGDSFDPPKQHLGKPLSDQSPVAVAELALEYADKMVKEACKFPLR